MTKVVQYQAEVFPILPSRCAHLPTKVLETVNENMEDLLKSLLCFSIVSILTLFYGHLNLQPFLALSLQTLQIQSHKGTQASDTM